MSLTADQISALVAQQVQQALAQASPRAPAPPNVSAPRLERPRLPPPPFYSGGANALDDWFSAMEQQINWYGAGLPDEAARLTWIGAYLQGPALDWWKTLVVKPKTVEEFAEQLRARFQPVNSAETARAKLLALAQGKGGVQAYVDAFRRLLVRVPDMAEGDRVFQFLRGLQPTVATQIKIHGVTTLDKAIDVAVRVGSLMEHGATVQAQRAGAAAASSHSPMELDNIEGLEGETSGAEGAGTSSTDDAPVTRAQLRELLNAMREERRGPSHRGGAGARSGPSNPRMRGLPQIPHLTPVQVQEYMDAGKCFGCGSKDHQSRKCPKRKEDAKGRVSWSN
jgi:hypothetical protein